MQQNFLTYPEKFSYVCSKIFLRMKISLRTYASHFVQSTSGKFIVYLLSYLRGCFAAHHFQTKFICKSDEIQVNSA